MFDLAKITLNADAVEYLADDVKNDIKSLLAHLEAEDRLYEISKRYDVVINYGVDCISIIISNHISFTNTYSGNSLPEVIEKAISAIEGKGE